MTREERANILASVSRENPVAFHETSQYPITKEIEDKLEQMSLAVTKEEYGNEFWKDGVYMCSKCHQQLYVSSAKFKGWVQHGYCICLCETKLILIQYQPCLSSKCCHVLFPLVLNIKNHAHTELLWNDNSANLLDRFMLRTLFMAILQRTRQSFRINQTFRKCDQI